MRDGNVIEVKDVHKKFKNYFDKSNSLKEKVLQRNRNRHRDYWVLRGITFDIHKGEAVGIVGCNGCGKSTTLKLLSKIIFPDKGDIEIQGRVSSLLELGAGFHPDLSGYDNIYLNASVFGLTRKEINRRAGEIIRFSELEEFINHPIRTYSSGMYMKLAFSVAINVDADILLIDEILGVGDVSFQKKCFEKLMEIKDKGTTIVIVSHSTEQIERICDRSIWIEKGMIRQIGRPEEVHREYLDVMEERRLLQRKKDAEYKNEGNQFQNADMIAELQRKGKKEAYRQKELIKIAEEKRQEQQAVHESFKLDEIPPKKVEIEYYKKETSRLELVVEEKNIEIERLNSVIRQKDLLIERNTIELKKEIDFIQEQGRGLR